MPNLPDWKNKGFSSRPAHKLNPRGIAVYRCWGSDSTELGTGFFSAHKPTSVVEAELKYNIADWGNAIHFVSTFFLKPGFPYFIGPVAHGSCDLSLPADQIFVPSPHHVKVVWQAKELLKHDATVIVLNTKTVRAGKERGQA